MALVLTVLLLGGCAVSHRADGPEPAYRWVELGPDGVAIARVITSAEDCPRISFDGSSQPMKPRSIAPPGGFDILVCQASVPPGTRSADIQGAALALPRAQPGRIVVVGDTGCRIKGSDVQNCTGAGTGPPWIFAQVAQAIAALEPDLIIHVGDYLYRESPCPVGHAGCEGSPYGDNWGAWDADFFQPASPLLARAPWIFTRGNHENCARSWKGWFFLLEPRPLPTDPWPESSCQAYTAPYRLTLGHVALLMMDTAQIPGDYSPTPDPTAVAQYRREFGRMDALADDTTWLATHRPFWAIASFVDRSGQTQLGSTDLTLQTALQQSRDGRLPPGVKLLLSGHEHQFEMLHFADGRPPQMVAGGGGTKLDPPVTEELLRSHPQVLTNLNVQEKAFTPIHAFTFALVEPDSNGWKVTVRNTKGEVTAAFQIERQASGMQGRH